MNLQHAVDTYRGHTIPRFRFSERRNVWFAISGAVILLSLIGFFWRGLNYSIDFKGGSELTYAVTTPLTAEQVDAVLTANGHPDSTVQIANGGKGVTIRTKAFASQDERAKVLAALAKQAGVQPTDISEKTVGATWGSEISQKALRGLIVVLAAIALYISLRFEWKMAIGAMIALVHDLLITGGIYALTGRSVTPETVIAILTILGFSLYDTVVIYDKIKENSESTALVARLGYTGVVDLSLNQVLMRSVNTSLVVLLPIVSLLFFGGATLKDFAFAMFVGVTTGAYSSIFIAAPILTLLKGREDRFRQIEARRAQRETGGRVTVATGPALAAVEPDGPAAVTATSEAAATRAVARAGSSSRPRPKSKRKPPAKRRRR
ncbi:MAG: protein translocase subunit SecF [Actinomycetota bacterium]|nr:protein translocase subunit SecF [Actinomycetota bacterium]